LHLPHKNQFSFSTLSLFLFKLQNMRKRFFYFFLLCSITVYSQNNNYPSWILQGNIYEVNVRQYTKEGTFKAFEKHLPRLKAMGVQTLWFMPINPISKKDRKGALGSYYAVANYKAVNPEFGNISDWKQLVKHAHDMGFKVIIDWVPNHTGADNVWIKSHPDFYELDPKTHQPLSPFDWTDVRQLNFKNQEMQDSMLSAMKFWITQSDIDGYRVDHVVDFQKDFWLKAIPALHKLKNNFFMLAEANDAWCYDIGFNATYPWDAFNVMKEIASGNANATALDKLLQDVDKTIPRNAIRMYFTSNHDENSWNKADYGTMPGEIHAPFAVLTQTIEHSVPEIYSGQEEPFIEGLHFFYKDQIAWSKFARAKFYKTLLNLRKNNSALAADASYKKLRTNDDNALFAFEREKNGNKVLVIVNLSKKPQQLSWKDQPSANEWNNVFLGHKEPVDKGFNIEPWGYAVYELKK